ncbi:MAG: ATP-binding protein [Candidatus Ferrigenium altingense]
MDIPSESAAPPRRLSVGFKLGAVFLLLVTLATGNLYFVGKGYDSIANVADIINQSRQLRYLSQQIAFQSASFLQEPGEAARQSKLKVESEFKMRYASVAREIGQLHPLMRSAGDNLEEHLEHIDKTWQRQHIALERVLVEPDLAVRQAAQREVVADAVVMLSEADHLVGALEKAANTAHRRVNFIIYLVQALAALFTFLLFLYVRSRIIVPITRLTDFTRHFAAGERGMHMDFHSNDEVGELVSAFNSTVIQTAELIDKFDRLNAELEEKVAARTAELAHAWIEAEQANRAKSDFLATMSHEIRTPMNGVIGMIDVLQQSSLNGQQMEMANIIHDSAFALLAIIDDILDFSKIEAGKLQINRQPMSIANVVEGSCETLIPLASKKGVELTLFTDPCIPAAVMGDPGRLRQILVNLANNAIKFSSGQQRQGRASVRALLTESTPEQATLEFRVADNGIGMDEATQARLFAPFTQADSTTTRNFGGTGLGLVISRRLANMMGGEITLHSAPGKGATLNVRISFERAPANPEINAASSLVAGLDCLVAGGSESLADDLAAYLVHDGAVVERATDMAVVKQWVATRTPGLHVAVIDTAVANSPLSTSLLDELRAATRANPEQQIRFVVIGRESRRGTHLEGTDLVMVDGNVLTRSALLKAVAIAAGRAKQPELKARHSDANVNPLLSREEARRQGSLILVAEDNEINQKVILQQLMLLGQTADIANNGREALGLWTSGDYAILFADLHMPAMDGYELTAAIRAAEKTGKPRMPIIAFTANAIKGEAERCLAIGMDDYLSKPVQLVNLKAMLEKWLPRSTHEAAGEMQETSAETGDSPRSNLTPLRQAQDRLEGGGAATLPASSGASPDTVVVDVKALKALIGDDEAMVREFLHDFRISAAKIAVELRAACAAGQATVAGALAHKLKSSSRSVGALALGELCAGMEQAGKAGDTETLAALLPKFEQELLSVEGFIAGY